MDCFLLKIVSINDKVVHLTSNVWAENNLMISAEVFPNQYLLCTLEAHVDIWTWIQLLWKKIQVLLINK